MPHRSWCWVSLITIAGFGSGAWHPQATTNATVAGGKHWGATAASVFFQGGMLGSALLGAALGGYLLSNYGRQALLVISAIAVLGTLVIVRPNVPRWLLVADKAEGSAARETHDTTRTFFWVILAFLLLGTALKAMTSQSLTAYVPKQQQDLGVSAASYGLLMSAFMIAGRGGRGPGVLWRGQAGDSRRAGGRRWCRRGCFSSALAG